MDVAYNQHSPYSRHSSRSHTNLNHLTLAPLTTRLPLNDSDDLPQSAHHVSYLEGRSAPTTPSILSHSSSRVSMRKPELQLPKSKSSTHLLATRKQPRSGQTTPGGTKLRKGIMKDDLSISTISAKDRNDSDWLLRAGAAMSSSARESKGQSWLVSRASSTSLTGQRDEDEEVLERELAREREQTSRRASRRGSTVGSFADDEFSPINTRRSLSFGPATGLGSRPMSRFGSRGNSRRGSRAQLYTPGTGERESYFDQRDFAQEEYIAEPDFVDVDEEVLAHDENEEKNDEAIIKKLARASNIGLGGWVEKMLGWSLFAVDEDGEDEIEPSDMRGEQSEMSSRTYSRTTLDGTTDPLPGDVPPPLRDDEAGGWQDAAWLLSVATKVLL